MTFQCTLNTRLKKIAVVAAKSKQYSPFDFTNDFDKNYNFLLLIHLEVDKSSGWATK